MALKKIIYTAFVAFVSSVATIAVMTRFSRRPPAPPRLSLADVARHSSRGDCWLAVSDGVYDVTRYIPEHPAPEKVLTAWCGREATKAFATKGVGRPHSAAARAQLEAYRVGELASPTQ